MDSGTCLLCFAANVKTFDIIGTPLQDIYKEIFVLKVQTENCPHRLCYICCAKLQQCYSLIKQTRNIRLRLTDENHQVEYTPLVRLAKVLNPSKPYHFVAIKKESDVKEERSDHLTGETMPHSTTVKMEPEYKEMSDLAHWHTAPSRASGEEYTQTGMSSGSERSTTDETATEITPQFVTVKLEPDVKEEISDYETDSEMMPRSATTKLEPEVKDISDYLKVEINVEDNGEKSEVNDAGGGSAGPETPLVHKKTFGCNVCNRQFQRRSHLNTHIVTHTGAKPYSCDLCSKEFKQKSHLNTHKLTHTGAKPYICDICDKKFSVRSYLNSHKATHSVAKPYSCDICHMKFRDTGNLNKHKVIHTGVKPYSCDICEKTFRHTSTLNKHKVTHSNDKPFACDTCTKSFSTRDSLHRHKWTHTGLRPYSCDICKKEFSRRCHLNRHKLTHANRTIEIFVI